MLESNNQDVVKEIKQLIYEQYDEGKLKRVIFYSVGTRKSASFAVLMLLFIATCDCINTAIT